MSNDRESLAAIEAAQNDLRRSIARTRELTAETDRLIDRNHGDRNRDRNTGPPR